MLFKEYQEQALKTWGGPEKLRRAAFALYSEVGEVIGKVEKNWRTDYEGNPEKFKEALSKEVGDVLYYISVFAFETDDHSLDDVVIETAYDKNTILGEDIVLENLIAEAYFFIIPYINNRETSLEDVYVSLLELCQYFELDLNAIAEQNIAKLADRAARNVIKGSGDDR